jgi:hypothetical protein
VKYKIHPFLMPLQSVNFYLKIVFSSVHYVK